MKILVSVFSLVLLLTPALMAAEDLSGTWAGSFNITMDGETKDDVAHMILKQEGMEITGTAGPNSDQQWPIKNGKIDGNKVTFEVHTDGPVIKFELTLTDSHLKGEAKAEHEGKQMSAVVDLQRKSE